MRPSSLKINDTTILGVVVLGEDVEKGHLLDAGSSGVLGNGRDVEDAEAGAVVALVGEAAADELVVVDAARVAAVDARQLGGLEGADVPEVGDGEAGGALAGGVVLVVLVVEHEVLLPLGVEDPALVRVRGALVRGARDDVGGVLVRHVKDGQGVLVVAVADVTLAVGLVGTAVHEALGVVHVAVAAGAAGGVRGRGVRQVDEDEARGAAAVARLGAHGHGVVLLLVDDDVVRAADGQFAEPARQVVLVAERLGRGRVDVEQQRHVKDLHAVVGGLAADDDVVLVALDLAPQRRLRRRPLRQPAQVHELAGAADFGKGGAVALRNRYKLAALVAGPSPAAGALSDRASKVKVALKVIKVNLFNYE